MVVPGRGGGLGGGGPHAAGPNHIIPGTYLRPPLLTRLERGGFVAGGGHRALVLWGPTSTTSRRHRGLGRRPSGVRVRPPPHRRGRVVAPALRPVGVVVLLRPARPPDRHPGPGPVVRPV